MSCDLNSQSSNYVQVKQDHGCGCIDESMEITIPTIFRYVNCQSDVLYPVLNDNGWAYFNPHTQTSTQVGVYDYLEPYIEETALAYTLDSVFILNQEHHILFKDKRENLSRIRKSQFFKSKIDDNANLLVTKNGNPSHNFIGNDFSIAGDLMIIYGTNHFPNYRGESVKNYVYETTLVNAQSGDTLIETSRYDNMEFINDHFLYGQIHNENDVREDLIDLRSSEIVVQTNPNEYIDFPLASDYPYLKIINYKSDLTTVINLSGDTLFSSTTKDVNYIPDLDLVITHDNFKSYLLDSEMDTIFDFKDWILSRQFDFTMSDIRNYIIDDQVLVNIDSSFMLVDKFGSKNVLKGLTSDKFNPKEIAWKNEPMILISEDVSLNDSLTDQGIYFLYQLYDLSSDSFASSVYEEFQIQGDLLILENKNSKEIYSTSRKTQHTIQKKRSHKLESNFVPFQLLLNTEVNKSNEPLNCDQSNKIQLEIDTTTILPYNEFLEGYKLLISNCSGDKINISALDKELFLVTEVFFRNEWIPLETSAIAWCGNSYSDLELDKDSVWEIIVPKYSDENEGTFRIHLTTFNKDHGMLSYFSNTFKGGFNKSQLFVNDKE